MDDLSTLYKPWLIDRWYSLHKLVNWSYADTLPARSALESASKEALVKGIGIMRQRLAELAPDDIVERLSQVDQLSLWLHQKLTRRDGIGKACGHELMPWIVGDTQFVPYQSLDKMVDLGLYATRTNINTYGHTIYFLTEKGLQIDLRHLTRPVYEAEWRRERVMLNGGSRKAADTLTQLHFWGCSPILAPNKPDIWGPVYGCVADFNAARLYVEEQRIAIDWDRYLTCRYCGSRLTKFWDCPNGCVPLDDDDTAPYDFRDTYE